MHTHGGAVGRQWKLRKCQLKSTCVYLRAQLTEDSSRRIVTGETGLTHTRASIAVSVLLLL